MKSHMKSAAVPAWQRLQRSLERSEPNCAGDPRFVADRTELDSEDVGDMREICAACPLFRLCSAYQKLDKPRGGFWAGVAA